MLFNSYEFLLYFLPLVFLLFWYGGRSLRWRLGFLTVASYCFYSWWQFSDWRDLVRSFRIAAPGYSGGRARKENPSVPQTLPGVHSALAPK